MQTCGFLIMKKSINISRRKRAATCVFLNTHITHTWRDVTPKSVRAAVKFDNIIIRERAVSIVSFALSTDELRQRDAIIWYMAPWAKQKGLRPRAPILEFVRERLHSQPITHSQKLMSISIWACTPPFYSQLNLTGANKNSWREKNSHMILLFYFGQKSYIFQGLKQGFNQNEKYFLRMKWKLFVNLMEYSKNWN